MVCPARQLIYPSLPLLCSEESLGSGQGLDGDGGGPESRSRLGSSKSTRHRLKRPVGNPQYRRSLDMSGGTSPGSVRKTVALAVSPGTPPLGDEGRASSPGGDIGSLPAIFVRSSSEPQAALPEDGAHLASSPLRREARVPGTVMEEDEEDEEEAMFRAAAEKKAARAVQEQQAAAVKKAEEEATAKAKAEEEAAAAKKAEEEAAAKKKAEEEAAAKKAEEEAAAAEAAEEGEEAAKREEEEGGE